MSELEDHRARRRQATLDRLRRAAETSESAARLLADVDPRGNLRYWLDSCPADPHPHSEAAHLAGEHERTEGD